MSLHPLDHVTKALESLHVSPSRAKTAVLTKLEQVPKENIDRLLCKGSAVSIIRSNMPPCKMQIVGDELYRLLGYEYCETRLREAGHQEEINPEFQNDCSIPFESMTFRFELKGTQSEDLVNQLHQKVGEQLGVHNISKPRLISDQKTQAYLFTLHGQMQKFHFVFYKEMQNSFVATTDALQVVVHENGEYSLQDNGLRDAWIKDTYMKVYRVVNSGCSNMLQLFLRVLDRGFTLTKAEYEIFEKKCGIDQVGDTLYFLWNSAINEQGSLRNIFHICNLCHGAGMEEELAAFLKRVVPEHVLRYGKLEERNDFGSLSLAMISSGLLSYQEWLELSQFLGLFNGTQSSLDMRSPMLTFMRLIPTLHRQPLFDRYLKHFDPLPERKGRNSQVAGSVQAATIVRYEHAKKGHDLRALYLPCLFLAAVLRQDDFVRFALRSLPQAVKACGDAMHHLIGQGMRRLFDSFSLVLPEHLQNGGLSSEKIEREWIEFLLCQPHTAFQQAGINHLLACDRYSDLQLKICPILVKTNPQAAAVQITKLQSTLADEQAIGWINSSTHKDVIVSELLHRNSSRWLAPCVASFPDVVASVYEGARSEEVLLALTKTAPSQHSRSIITWWTNGATATSADSGLRAHLDEVVKLDGWTVVAKLCLCRLLKDAKSQNELAELLSIYSAQVDNFVQWESKLTDDQVISWLKGSSVRCAVVSDLMRVNQVRWLIPLAVHFPEEVAKSYMSFPSDELLKVLLSKETVPYVLISYLATKIAQNIQIFQTLKVSAAAIMLHLCHHRHHAAVWDSSFITCFNACVAEFNEKQYKRHAFDFLPLALHPQAITHNVNFVSQVLQVLVIKDLDAASFTMPKGHMPLSSALAASGLHLERLSLIRLQQVSSGRPPSHEDSEAVIESLRQTDEVPEIIMRWYLALELPYKVFAVDQVRNIFFACQRHPILISEKSKRDLVQLHKRVVQSVDYPQLQEEVAASLPEDFSAYFEPYAIRSKEKPQAAVPREPASKRDHVAFATELLAQKSASRSDVERTLDALLGQANPDPQSQVFPLLSRNRIYAICQWRRAFSRFFEKEMFAHIAYGIDIFQKIKDEKTQDFRKLLWHELFKHIDWIEKSNAVHVFKELSMLESELDLTFDHNTLMRIVACLVRALEMNKKLHAEYLPIALDIIMKVPSTHEERSTFGWRLLSLSSDHHPSEVIEKASSLLVSILPSLHGGVSLVHYLQATCLAQNCKASVDPLQQLIKQVQLLDNFELNAVLVRQLAYHPELSVKEALTDILFYLFRKISVDGFTHPNAEEIAQATTDLRDVLVRNGGVRCLQKIYDVVIRRDEELPSKIRHRWNEALATFDPEVPNGPKQNSLLPFTLSYSRFLVEAAASNNPQEIRDALEIDLSLSIHNKKNALLVRSFFENYNTVVLLLFLRQLEHFGWDQASQNFFRHMAHRAIVPAVLSNLHNPQKDDLTLIHREHYMVSTVDANRAGFYQFGKDSMTMRVIPVLSTSRQTALMSETSYRVFIRDLITTTLERVKFTCHTTEIRSRLLDLASSNLAVFCELYPQDPEIPKLYRALCFSVSPHDALWDRHASIFLSLYRLAILHGALDTKSPIFEECLAYLPAPNEEARKQNAAIVDNVSKEAGEMLVGKRAFTIDRLIELQESLTMWRETSFSGTSSFDLMLDCIKRLTSLWVMHPEILDSPKVIQTMKSLVLPRRRFFGVGLRDLGNNFAYQAATELFKRLMFLYQTLKDKLPADCITIRKQKGQEVDISMKVEGTRYMECLKWIFSCSKTFLRAQAYDKHFSDWHRQGRLLFDMIFDAKNEPFMLLIGEPLVGFTSTLCQAVPGSEHYKARVELVTEWMKRVFAYKGRYNEHVKIHVIFGLIQSNIIQDIQEKELQEVLRWMHMISEVCNKIPKLPLLSLVGQLQHNKWTSKNSKSGKAFWKDMPKFIRVI